MPASRKARAITFAPRSCPSRPGFAINTRIFFSGIWIDHLVPVRCDSSPIGAAERILQNSRTAPTASPKFRRCLLQIGNELLEQNIEFVGVVHEKRVPSIVERLEFRAGDAFLHVLKYGLHSLRGPSDHGGLVDLPEHGAIICRYS